MSVVWLRSHLLWQLFPTKSAVVFCHAKLLGTLPGTDIPQRPLALLTHLNFHKKGKWRSNKTSKANPNPYPL